VLTYALPKIKDLDHRITELEAKNTKACNRDMTSGRARKGKIFCLKIRINRLEQQLQDTEDLRRDERISDGRMINDLKTKLDAERAAHSDLKRRRSFNLDPFKWLKWWLATYAKAHPGLDVKAIMDWIEQQMKDCQV